VTAIGELRHRLVIEAPAETPDGAGGVTRTFSTIATVWAAIEPVSADGRLIADREMAALGHRIVLRRRDDLTLNHRFRLGARVFAIRVLSDPDERGEFLQCLVGEERP
jgi:SPP1 family predicted phage head-tail adaptor